MGDSSKLKQYQDELFIFTDGLKQPVQLFSFLVMKWEHNRPVSIHCGISSYLTGITMSGRNNHNLSIVIALDGLSALSSIKSGM